jgi:hypothetical protein
MAVSSRHTFIGTGIALVGVTAFLAAPPAARLISRPTVNLAAPAPSPAVLAPTAPVGSAPIDLDPGFIRHWIFGPFGPAASVDTLGADADAASGPGGNSANAAGLLQTANLIGPLILDQTVFNAITASQAPPGAKLPPGTQPDHVGAINVDQWLDGVPGFASTAGTIGGVAGSDFGVNGNSIGDAAAAGFLQTSNQAGPFTFNLNVLKAIGASQDPTDGSDHVTALDIGVWNGALGSLITNTGTVGWWAASVTNSSTPFIGGAPFFKTTTTIGPFTIDPDFGTPPVVDPPAVTPAVTPALSGAKITQNANAATGTTGTTGTKGSTTKGTPGTGKHRRHDPQDKH